MRGELLSPDAPGWRRRLGELEHDLYHLPGYLRLEAGEGERPVAYSLRSAGRSFFLPQILRPVPGGGYDAASPYGYPGPLAGPPPVEPGFVAEAVEDLAAGLRELDAISLFVRLHPVLDRVTPALAASEAVVFHGHTVGIDLAAPREEQWRQIRSNHRRQIRRAEREGFRFRVDSSWRRLPTFVELYRQNMHRVGADAGYHFPPSYFERLREIAGARVHLAVVERDGETACGGLFSEVGGLVQYHLSGTGDAHVRDHPLKLLLDGMRRWASRRELSVFHLGGGVGGREDSLFDFKAGFSRRRFRFSTWRRVLDGGAYARHCRERGVAARPADDPAYFPAYRAPDAAAAPPPPAQRKLEGPG